MNAYILNNNTLIFWTPKCACTSLYNITQQVRNIKCARYGKEIYRKIDSKNIGSFDIYKKIFLMRNPYDRIVSAYINKFVYHPDNGYLDEFGKLENFAQDLLKKSPTLYLSNGQYVGISFNEFIELVSKHYDMSDHWNKQKKINNINFDYIIHVENLQSELKRTFNELKIPIGFNIPHNNKSNYGMNYGDVDLSNIKSLDIINNHMMSLNKNNLLNENNKNYLYKIYKDDFELGGYSI